MNVGAPPAARPDGRDRVPGAGRPGRRGERTARCATRPRPTTPTPTGSCPAPAGRAARRRLRPGSGLERAAARARRARAARRPARRRCGAPVEIEFALVARRRASRRASASCRSRPLLVRHETVERRRRRARPARARSSASRPPSATAAASCATWSTSSPQTLRGAADAGDRRRDRAAQPRSCVEEGRPYLLVGFGRWGSSDPWLGIPVRWDQIAGARAIVEATLPQMNPEPSQGSHFFHNLSSFSVLYFTVPHDRAAGDRLGVARRRSRRVAAHARTSATCARERAARAARSTGARGAASCSGRRRDDAGMNPARRRQADRPHPARPAGAGEGAQLPLPGRRAARPRGGPARRRAAPT